MNKVRIIRKGAGKDYWINGIVGGFILGLFAFLLSLINNEFSTALVAAIIMWCAVIVIYIGIGFMGIEYFKRKKKIKELYSEKYTFLDENNFKLNPDLYFEGQYRGFWFKVIPMTQWTEEDKEIGYVMIESFYSYQNGHEDQESNHELSGDYSFGKLFFASHYVGFIPINFENPDFRNNFDQLIQILKKESLEPLSISEWEDTLGRKLKSKRDNEEKKRTKQLLKIGKLDIKYISRKDNQ